MKNEEENREQPQEAQAPKPSASPTLADKITELGLDEDTSNRLAQLIDGMAPASLSSELLSTLARGITHDADVQNADAEGYLRGRNEKIETVLPPERDSAESSETNPVFPQYCRRSIWD